MSLERAIETPQSDQEMLRFLSTPSRLALPATIDPTRDPLGLMEHKEPYEAAAQQVFFGLSYICSQIAENDSQVRAQFREARGVIEFPTVQVGSYHRFGIRRFEDKGKITYEFYRADNGNPEGGFFAIRNSDGSVVLRRTLEGTLDDENDYPEVLGSAQRALLVYAKKRNIRMEILQEAATDDHLDDYKIQSLIKRAQREAKLHYRIMSGVGDVAGRIGNTAYALFTKENDTGVGRRLAVGRVALAAALLPLPGFSQSFFDTIVPRPASVEAVAGLASAAAGIATPDKKPDPEALYDERQLDLPAEATLPAEGEHPIVVVSAVGDVASHKIIDLRINETLRGTSPRRVVLREDLRPNACQRLGVNPAIQDNQLLIATTNERMAGQITVESSQAAVYVCNNTGSFIDNEELDLTFDSRPAPE